MSALEETCNICRGTGFARVTRGEGEKQTSGVVTCECVKARAAAKLAFNPRGDWPLPPMLEEATFKTFELKGTTASIREAHAGAKAWAEKPDGGILFTGSVGTGKSHLAVAILYQANRRAHFASVPMLMRRLRDTFNSTGPTDTELLRELSEVPLLVLDDIGAERSTGNSERASSYTEETLYLLVNERHMHRRPTVFTTNKAILEGPDVELLGDWIGARTFDRILGMCWQNIVGRLNAFTLTGPSKRWGR